MQSPKPYSLGRIVLYVPQVGQNFGGNYTSPLPAVIVNAWEEVPSYKEDGKVNLKVLTDAATDGWATSVIYSEGKEPGTWHWPEIK